MSTDSPLGTSKDSPHKHNKISHQQSDDSAVTALQKSFQQANQVLHTNQTALQTEMARLSQLIKRINTDLRHEALSDSHDHNQELEKVRQYCLTLSKTDDINNTNQVLKDKVSRSSLVFYDYSGNLIKHLTHMTLDLRGRLKVFLTHLQSSRKTLYTHSKYHLNELRILTLTMTKTILPFFHPFQCPRLSSHLNLGFHQVPHLGTRYKLRR